MTAQETASKLEVAHRRCMEGLQACGGRMRGMAIMRKIWRYGWVALLTAAALAFICYGEAHVGPGEREVAAWEYASRKTADWDSLRGEQAQAQEDLGVSVWYQDTEIPYWASQRTFYCPLVEGSSWEELKLSVRSEGNYEICFAQDWTEDSLEEAVEGNVRYSFYVYDGQVYQEYGLVFTGMPAMIFTTRDDPSMEEGSLAIDMKLLDTDGSRGYVTESEGNFHVRGGLSRNYPKLGYKLNLTYGRGGGQEKNHCSLLGMRQDDDWILTALYNDDSKMRDKLARDLWNYLPGAYPGVECAGSRMEYVELFIDDSYYGLYGLAEPVDKKTFSMSGEDALYKRGGQSAFEVGWFYPEQPSKEIAGFEVQGEEGDARDWAALIPYLELFLAPDDVYRETASEVMDAENLTDYWLYLQLVMGVDNRNKNYFCAVPEGEGGTAYLIPWDCDLTFGLDLDSSSPVLSAYNVEMTESILAWEFGDRYLREDIGGAKELAAEKWAQYRETWFSEEYIAACLEEYERKLTESGALEREYFRWEGCAQGADAEDLYGIAVRRLEFLDGLFYSEDYWEYLS